MAARKMLVVNMSLIPAPKGKPGNLSRNPSVEKVETRENLGLAGQSRQICKLQVQ